MPRSNDTRVIDAILRPHDGNERLDPDFIVTHRCERCGKLGVGPRKHLAEAIAEHNRRCPVLNRDGSANVARILYPRSQ
jgi:hypothetical protein